MVSSSSTAAASANAQIKRIPFKSAHALVFLSLIHIFLARALEIPAVVAAAGILSQAADGDEIILDGESGEIFVKPEESVKAEYEAKRASYLAEKEELKKYIGRETITKDGVKIEVAANIGRPEDVDRVLSYDAEGIGLFRTEFLFMDCLLYTSRCV